MYEIFLKKVKAELTFLFKQLIEYKHIGFFYNTKNGLNSPGYILQYICIPNYIVSSDLSEMSKCDICLYFDIQQSDKNDLNIRYENNVYYVTFLSDSDKTYLTYGQAVSSLIIQLLKEILHVEQKQMSNLEWLMQLGLKKEDRH